MNKKGLSLTRDWVIAGVIFSAIIALLVLSVGDLANTYDRTDIVDSDFSDKFDRFENNTEIASDMWNQATGEEGFTTIGTFDLLFKSSFSIITLVFSSVSLVGSQVFGFVEYFGIPKEVGGIIFTTIVSILSIIVVFIVISSVSRRDL